MSMGRDGVAQRRDAIENGDDWNGSTLSESAHHRGKALELYSSRGSDETSKERLKNALTARSLLGALCGSLSPIVLCYFSFVP